MEGSNGDPEGAEGEEWRSPSKSTASAATSRAPSFVEMASVPGSVTESPLFVDGKHVGGGDVERASLDCRTSWRSSGSFHVDRGGASWLSCAVNLTNTIVGAGMLGLPKAFANCGSLLGAALLVVFAAASCFGLHLLSAAAKLASDGRPASFRSVATAAAPRFASLIDVAVAVKCFGVATSYLIVVGQTVPVVFAGSGVLTHRRSWILGSAALVAPVSFLRNLDALKVTSACSLGFVAFLTVMIVQYRFAHGCDDCASRHLAQFDMNAAKTLTIFIFGYTCHQNIFAVVNELRDPTQARVDAASAAAVGTACVVYVLVAWCGYYSFGAGVAGDVLENYPKTTVVTVARGFVALLVLPSYPLQLFPSRQCVLTLLDALAPSDGDERALARRHAAVTGAFLGCSLFIALAVEDLSVVLAVVGATGSTAVSYILPGGIFYVLAPPSFKRKLALCHFLLGCAIVPAALTLIFLE